MNFINNSSETFNNILRLLIYLKHNNIDVKNKEVLKGYLFLMDKYKIIDFYTPYIWVDYLFIDDHIMSILLKNINKPFKKKEYSIADILLMRRLLDEDIIPHERINHYDFLLNDSQRSYYENCRENFFLLKNYDQYQGELLNRIRNLKLAQLI